MTRGILHADSIMQMRTRDICTGNMCLTTVCDHFTIQHGAISKWVGIVYITIDNSGHLKKIGTFETQNSTFCNNNPGIIGILRPVIPAFPVLLILLVF